jgi:multiple sugar transport system substrate-binding protein
MRVSFYASGWIHPDPRTIADLAEEFNRQHPEIEVQATSNLPVPAGESIDLAGMAGKIDCLSWPYTPPAEAASLFYTLDDFLATDESLSARAFSPPALDAFRVDGALYGLPAASLPLVIYYNPDLLAEAGLAAPEGEWTFEEFLALAAGASGNKDGKPTYGFVPYQADYTTFLLAGRGINWYDPERDPAVLRFDDPQIVNAALWLRELAAAGVMPEQFGADSTPERERLVNQGQAALWTQFAFLTPGYDPIDQEFQAWVAPPPQAPGMLPAPSSSALYISRRTATPRACWEWFTFLSNHPAAFLGVPANQNVAQSAEWENLFSSGADRASLAEAYREAAARPALARPPDPYLRDWLTAALAAVIAGGDANTTLAATQVKAERYQACLEAEASRAGVTALTEEQKSKCAAQANP